MAGAASGAQLAENPIPNTILKSEQKLTQEQATELQDQWVQRAGIRRGAPAILPPKLDFSVLSFAPKDLLLLEAQQWGRPRDRGDVRGPAVHAEHGARGPLQPGIGVPEPGAARRVLVGGSSRSGRPP